MASIRAHYATLPAIRGPAPLTRWIFAPVAAVKPKAPISYRTLIDEVLCAAVA